MANLAVRHVDTELAEATRHAYQQALGVVVCGRLNTTFFGGTWTHPGETLKLWFLGVLLAPHFGEVESARRFLYSLVVYTNCLV
jgi:hypothetical protein